MASSHSCEFFSDKEAKSLTSLYNKGGLAAVIPVIKDKLHNLENETLNIAVTGCTGSGKSAFINALRGLRSKDEGAAPVGVIETTMEAKVYKHPNLPGVNLWDLPGTGSPTFQAKDYLKKVDLNKYDFFVIMAAKRFTENDANLAVAIEKMGKQFFFIRTQIDNDIRSYELEGIEYNREEVLQTIRNDCIAKLIQIGIQKPCVFLLSNYHVNEYDFTAFTQTIEAELSEIKEHVTERRKDIPKKGNSCRLL
ncbi:interferon-inducible GTPase 5-like [Huso huso]|uniref:Interferon-inducible GTPase 5-like n=1 Tax=Huso huso TaxID=61971 RepID=A0ABR0Z0L7_HUSHU